MKSPRIMRLAVLSTAFLCSWNVASTVLQAEEVAKAFRYLTSPFRAMHHEKPETGQDDCIEQLANEIDWLEHHLDRFGSVVTKHPDVWGESRLMRHRYEYERQMEAQLGGFEVRMNAALRRSDQAFLGMAFALQAAADGEDIPAAGSSEMGAASVANVTNLLPSTNETGDKDDVVIYRSGPFENGNSFSFENNQLSLEPTIQLDQMSRYINHLHELRRINEGDDIADSPGYSLNLVRIPVSILPGKHTRKGYGAEVTVIAEPYLGDDLLPVTFRGLVINDLVDTLAPALTTLANHPDIVTYAKDLREINQNRKLKEAYELKESIDRLESEEIHLKTGDNPNRMSSIPQGPVLALTDMGNGLGEPKSPHNEYSTQQELIEAQKKQLNKAWENLKLNDVQEQIVTNAVEHKEVDNILMSQIVIHIPSAKSRRSLLPLPASQFAEVFGSDGLRAIAVDIYNRLGNGHANHQTIHLMDVRAYLTEELTAAYEFLAHDTNLHLWEHAGHDLTAEVRTRRIAQLSQRRCQYYRSVNGDKVNDLTPETDCDCSFVEDFKICKQVTAHLAWALIVESSLLNDHLIRDMREVASLKECYQCNQYAGGFYFPNPSPEARMAFNEYVKCRWPIRVFALDPVNQEQNVQDEYARRRETQVAIALAFASGEINAQSMMRYTRRLEWDMATIALNRTVVGFSHGNDTFGWRFHPRFQTPPVKGTLATFGETIFGGPTTDADLRQRQLEPGMRECTAIVVMPSFVPYVRFDVRTNWFCLTHPKQTELSMRNTMELSRSIKSMKMSAAQCSQCAHLYRDGEVHRLLRRVDQLDRELPLQTMMAQIPHENTAGGFELFNRGVTDLAPELIGWYGSPGINRHGHTTMFLMGDGFSVHETRLTAGGLPVPFTLLSRQVMQVTIPPGVQIMREEPGSETNFDEVVDLHLATPYGVSSHLHVPVAKPDSNVTANRLAWTTQPKFTLHAKLEKKEKTWDVTMDAFSQVEPSVLRLHAPAILMDSSTPTIQLHLEADGGDYLGSVEFTASGFDLNTKTFFVAGANLKGLIAKGGGSKDGMQEVIAPYIKFLAEQRGEESGPVTLTGKTFLVVTPDKPGIEIEQPFVISVERKDITKAAATPGS